MYACIDLGSNSFHLLIGEWQAGKIHIVERLSEKVQLGTNVVESGQISAAAFQRGEHCLRRFKRLMQHYRPQQYWALGTNTFRIAGNARQFIQRAQQIGIRISVISGVQEAMLIYAGVISDLPPTDRHRLVVDIGGGSTEVIIGCHHRRLLTESLSIGSVAWRDRFFAAAAADGGQLLAAMGRARRAARETFASVAPGVRRAGWEEVHASSGTVKMLANSCQTQGIAPGYISRQALYALQAPLARAIADNAEFTGLKASRRELALPGWSVLTGLMEAYRIDKLRFSATALREGMLDFIVKTRTTPLAMNQSGLPDISSD